MATLAATRDPEPPRSFRIPHMVSGPSGRIAVTARQTSGQGWAATRTQPEDLISIEDIAAWHEFASALVDAAAVLAGLIFLAVSINIGHIMVIPGLPGRAGESVIFLLGVLVESALLLIPHQSATAVGIELLITAGLSWAMLNAIAISSLGKPTRQPRSWRLYRIVRIQLAAAPILLSGGSLLGWPAGGLYWFAAGVLFASVDATGNAWVLLVEVVRDERYRPLDDKPTGLRR
jgi:modulator of FtsH protease